MLPRRRKKTCAFPVYSPLYFAAQESRLRFKQLHLSSPCGCSAVGRYPRQTGKFQPVLTGFHVSSTNKWHSTYRRHWCFIVSSTLLVLGVAISLEILKNWIANDINSFHQENRLQLSMKTIRILKKHIFEVVFLFWDSFLDSRLENLQTTSDTSKTHHIWDVKMFFDCGFMCIRCSEMLVWFAGYTSHAQGPGLCAQDVDGLYEAGCTDFADVFVYASTQKFGLIFELVPLLCSKRSILWLNQRSSIRSAAVCK